MGNENSKLTSFFKNFAAESGEINCLNDIVGQRYSMFQSQDIEKGRFDVTFQFENQGDEGNQHLLLHAHKFILCPISKVFDTMLFGAWARNEPIPISTSKYDDFKKFLEFFYTGKMTLTSENISTMLDFAESYDVECLKRSCETYLKRMATKPKNALFCLTLGKRFSMEGIMREASKNVTITIWNFAIYYELSENCGDCVVLNGLRTRLIHFAINNIENLSILEGVVNISKEFLIEVTKSLCYYYYATVEKEFIFLTALKWTQYQLCNNNQLDLSLEKNKLAFRNLLNNFIVPIKLESLSIKFLSKSLLPIGNLFTCEELSEIFAKACEFKSFSSDLEIDLINNIYRSDATEFRLCLRKIKYEDFKKLVSNGKIKKLNFDQVTVEGENGEIIPIEKIIECLPNLKEFIYIFRGNENELHFITEKTAENLMKIPHFENLEKFYIRDVPTYFNLMELLMKDKKFQNIQVSHNW